LIFLVLFVSRQKGHAKPGVDERALLKGADLLGEIPPNVGMTEKLWQGVGLLVRRPTAAIKLSPKNVRQKKR
jgi:hypothetical protein